MRRSPFWIAGHLLLVFGFSAAFAGEGPLLRVSEREIDFGTIDQYQQVHKDLTIRNEGDEPLKILDLKADCGCTAAVPSDSVIAPGGSVTIDIAFSSGSREGNQKKTVTLKTNDPGEPRVLIRILANVHPLVRLSESRYRFDSIRKGRGASHKFRLASDQGVGLKIEEIVGESDYLTTAFRPVPDSKEEIYEIEVTVPPGASPGNFRDLIRIKLARPKVRDPEIVVIGTVISYFEFEGDGRLRLPSAPAAESTSGTVTIRCDGSKPYQILAVESPVPFLRGELVPLERDAYSIKVTRTEGAPPGRFAQTMKIKTSDPDQPVLELGVQGMVRR